MPVQDPVFSGKDQATSTVLGSKHRAHWRMSGPQATLMMTLMPAILVAVAHTDVPSWWSWSVCATSVGARQGQIYRGPRGQPFSLLSRDHDIINSLKCREFFSHTSLRKPLCSPTVHSYHLMLSVGTLTLVKTYEKHQKKMSREKCAPPCKPIPVFGIVSFLPL